MPHAWVGPGPESPRATTGYDAEPAVAAFRMTVTSRERGRRVRLPDLVYREARLSAIARGAAPRDSSAC